ncbi:recombinase family protein [Streptomyces sp. NPDC044948]|uniref:recombinase family protein n=1 Tax=Streptomyces sp. NPDC044948 TaxID=3157092 RepID=UPI0033DAAD1E
MIRIAIYLRVSTVQQLEGYGLKVQEEQCRNWIAAYLRHMNHVVVDVYVDGGVSGKLASREDLDRMTDDIMAGEIDLVIFGKLDRIGRTMKNIHRWVYDVSDKGVRIVTADGRIDSEDEMFGIQLSLLAYMAEVEHALILERTMGGRMQKIAAGGWPLGEPPFGVKLNDDGEPALNPAEVKQVEAFADFVLDSPEPVTREDAARHLNSKGYRTRTGKLWEGGNLSGRIRASLKGYVEFNFGGENEDGEEITTTFRIDVPKALPDDRAEAVLAWLKRTSKTRSAANSQYLLTNRLISVCGAHRTGASVTDGRSKNTAGRYYRCMAGRPGVPLTDRHEDCWELPADAVEAAVWSEIEGLLNNKAKLQELVEGWLGTVPDRAESYRRRISELDVQIEKKRKSRKKKIALLLASVDEDGADQDDAKLVEELKTELKAQETELAVEKDRVAEWLEEAEAQEERARDLLKAVAEVDTERDFTFTQKLDLMDLLDVRVNITDKGVPRHKGLADPITEWHRETGTPVPTELTDEMWDRVKDILSGTRQWADVRGAFDVMLEKLRTGTPWNEYSGSERIGGRGYTTLYRRVHHWHSSGEYQAALEALKGFDAAPVPPSYRLPHMLVTGAVDPEFTTADLGEHDCETSCKSDDMDGQASRRWSSSGSSSR